MHIGVISWTLRAKTSVFVVKSQTQIPINIQESGQTQIPRNILVIGVVQSKFIDFLPITSSHQTLLQLKCFSFHVLLYVDVISTIMQEIQLAWSAMLNPVKNNKQMWMKGIYGGDETDLKKNHQALFLTRS